MNIENIKLWIAALRSGEYEQYFQGLYSSDGKYCALGVVGKIFFNATEYNCVPSEDILQILGCEYNNDFYWDIVKKNDRDRMNFNQIADYVENEYINRASS